MKRFLALLLALSMLLLTGCGTEESAAPTASPNEAAYAAAEALMTAGDYAAAAGAFAALSGYSDAPQMAVYCQGLAHAAVGDHDKAVMAFTALDGFKDSAIKATWYTGVAAEAEVEAACNGSNLGALEAADEACDRAETAYGAVAYLPGAEAALARISVLRGRIPGRIAAERAAHRFENVGSVVGELFAVCRDGKWGLLHVGGELVIPCVYDELDCVESVFFYECFDGEFLLAKQDGKYGLIDMDGKILIPFACDEIYWWGDILLVQQDGLWGLTDFAGNVIAPCEAVEWDGNRSLIGLTDAAGEVRYYGTDGTHLDPETVLIRIYTFPVAADRFIVFEVDDRSLAYNICDLDLEKTRWSLVDGAGRVLYSNAVMELLPVPGDGVLWLQAWDGEKCYTGLMSADGDMLMPVEYLSDRLPRSYDTGAPLLGDVLLTAPDGTKTLYAADGRWLFDCADYDSVRRYSEDEILFEVHRDGMRGVVNMKGQEIVPCANYHSMNIFGGFVQANFREDKRVSIYDGEGRLVATLSKKWLLSAEALSCSTEYFAWIDDDDGLLRIVDQQGRQVY